jgi:effector-binding domain-containing protein
VTHDVRIEHADGRPIAVLRLRANANQLSRVVPESCGVVWKKLRDAGMRGGRHVAVYLDGAITLEVGVELDAAVPAGSGLIASATPAGTIATTTHVGPYQRLTDAHAAIRTFCKANGHACAGPNWEIYGHWMPEWDDNPGLIRTDVFYLLKHA